MSNPGNYTVGWICAIEVERVAAQAFLDEEHDEPDYLPVNDNNSYVLGRIGKHNVVIASTPHSQYGLVSAATVARDMVRSFPNVRIGLMVGIGGGAPSPKHDIRLGDIVVSSPGHGNGGVFQYDYGKTIQNKKFTSTGHLNQPPPFMLTAITSLKTVYRMKGHRLQESIENILSKYERLRDEYQRPGPVMDRLYKPDAVHVAKGDESCEAACGNNDSHLVIRSVRPANYNNPEIHYGLIASANQLMKNALIRDQLAAERDVLCFEMEAAGLMNHFPCLVIRGICDYSDTHKDVVWQGYAAMAAAAYAKDLLNKITPNKVEVERTLNEVFSDISNSVSTIKKTVGHVGTQLEMKEKLDFLNWLIADEYSSQHTDILKRWHPETGQWFINSDEFQEWLSTGKQTLYCPGIPGAGKTIITAAVIHHISERSSRKSRIGIAYFYFNFSRQKEQTVEYFLASVLRQFAFGQTSLPEKLGKLHLKCNRQARRPSYKDLFKNLKSILKLYTRAYIVMDALDECATVNGCRKGIISTVLNLQEETGVNIFVTSRTSDEIALAIEKDLVLPISARNVDIKKYLDHQMLLQDLDIFDQQFRKLVASELANAAKGMFLVAELHFNALMALPSKGDIKHALRNLAKGLDELDTIYELAMDRIENQGSGYKCLANKILAWIVHAYRPLSIREIQHALATKPHTTMLDEDYIPSKTTMISVCAGLVTVDDERGTIRLIHYTAQEYFIRAQSRWFPDAHLAMAKTCLTYLSFQEFGNGYQPDQDFEMRLRSNPFYDYAAHNWGNHARIASTCKRVVSFLQRLPQVEASAQALLAHEYRPFTFGSTSLHLAAYFGLKSALKAVWDENNFDKEDSERRTPLSYAVTNGHKSIAKWLLAKGARANPSDIFGHSLLESPVLTGNVGIAKLLVKKGAEVDSSGNGGRTWLELAFHRKDGAMAKLLFNYSHNTDSRDLNGRTPLSHAAENGWVTIVEQLLTHEVNVNSKDRDWRTPLSYAVENGWVVIVEQLLKYGVEVNSQDIKGRTPLMLAVQNRRETIVLLLLAEKARTDIHTTHFQTPLYVAIVKGYEAIVKMLLEGGIEADSLSLAADLGHVDIVNLLLQKIGSTLTVESRHTSLSWATWYGHEPVVRLLLAAEATGTAMDPNDNTWGLISIASKRGHEAIVKLLLEVDGGDAAPKINNEWVSLSYAARHGHKAVVELLLGIKGVQADYKDNTGRTPLSHAAERGRKTVVELLVSTKGVEVNSKDSDNLTPLSYAIRNGHDDITQLLLDNGATKRSRSSCTDTTSGG